MEPSVYTGVASSRRDERDRKPAGAVCAGDDIVMAVGVEVQTEVGDVMSLHKHIPCTLRQPLWTGTLDDKS